MLKLIGAAMILASGTCWGFFSANRLKKREDELEKLIFAIKLLENETVNTKRDIKTALRIVGEKNGPNFFCRAAENVERMGVCAALSEAIKYENDILGTDKKILEGLWQNIGMSDTDAQIKAINHTVGLLEEAKKAAGADYEKNGGLRRSMGFLAGAFAVIMLF